MKIKIAVNCTKIYDIPTNNPGEALELAKEYIGHELSQCLGFYIKACEVV